MIRLCECKEDTWENLLQNSKEATVYSSPSFLRSYGKPIRYFQCLDDGEPVGFFFVIESNNGFVTQPYQAYNGIHFTDFSNLKIYKQIEKKFEITQAFADFLFNEFEIIEFSNSCEVKDLRPFSWLNYHEREKGYFKIEVRYTSILNISSPEMLDGFKSNRINALKISEKSNLSTISSTDIEILVSLHEMTFARQGIERSMDEEIAVRNIAKNLILSDKARLFVTYFNNQPASASLFGLHQNRGYYLFGASNPEFRKTESGTRNLWDGFTQLRENAGIQDIDMVGVNSPQRGTFKLSFGGSIVPYFQIIKNAK